MPPNDPQKPPAATAQAAIVPASGPDAPFTVAIFALVAGAIAMGISPVFVRTADVGPFASAFWRVTLALPVLYLWALLERRGHPWPVFTRPVVLAGVFFAGDLVVWHLAILNTTMANATLMACLAPAWVLILSGTFIGERVPPRSFAGLVICLSGAVMLVGSSYAIEPGRIIGDLYGVATSFFFGLYFLATRVARRTIAGGAFLYSSTIVTSAILLAVALIAQDDLLPQTATGFASLAALGLFSHAGGQGLLAFALGSLSAAFSSLVIFLEALAAAVFGWVVFGEKMGAWQILGGLLILAGVWIARPARR